MLDLWTAYERHLRSAIARLASAEEVSQLPRLGRGWEEQTGNIRSYLEILANRQRNLIPPRPRRVHFSDVLAASPRFRAYSTRILAITRMLETADPALNDPAGNFFSSRVEHLLRRKLTKKAAGRRFEFAVFVDKMLFNWGIHHLHMGEAERTDDLLFAVIEDDDAYFIDVRTHGNFADVDLLEVVDRNWPDLFRLLPAMMPGENFTAAQIRNLRANNMGIAVNVNGRALMPKNLGTCDGGTLQVSRWMHYIRRLLTVHQTQLSARQSEIRCRIATLLGVPEEQLDFEVVEHEENFGEFIVLRECSTRVEIRYKFRDANPRHPQHGDDE